IACNNIEVTRDEAFFDIDYWVNEAFGDTGLGQSTAKLRLVKHHKAHGLACNFGNKRSALRTADRSGAGGVVDGTRVAFTKQNSRSRARQIIPRHKGNAAFAQGSQHACTERHPSYLSEGLGVIVHAQDGPLWRR